jgi:hypothetical protein
MWGHGLRTFLRFSWLERRMVLRAIIWLGLVELGLKWLGFKRMIKLVPSVRQDASPRVQKHIFMYTAAIDLAARRHVVDAHCLQKSLTLHYWLRREGIPSELKIGVRKDNDQLKAHAWVELAGIVVNDDTAAVDAFKPLMRADSVDGLAWNDRSTAASATPPPAAVRLEA